MEELWGEEGEEGEGGEGRKNVGESVEHVEKDDALKGWSRAADGVEKRVVETVLVGVKLKMAQVG